MSPVYFVYVATAIFTIFFLIWESKSWLNLFIKTILFFASVWGFMISVISLSSLGFIVRV